MIHKRECVSVNALSDHMKVEVKREECPELFSMIAEVANSTGNKMPKHVYLEIPVAILPAKIRKTNPIAITNTSTIAICFSFIQ